MTCERYRQEMKGEKWRGEKTRENRDEKTRVEIARYIEKNWDETSFEKKLGEKGTWSGRKYRETRTEGYWKE